MGIITMGIIVMDIIIWKENRRKIEGKSYKNKQQSYRIMRKHTLFLLTVTPTIILIKDNTTKKKTNNRRNSRRARTRPRGSGRLRVRHLQVGGGPAARGGARRVRAGGDGGEGLEGGRCGA